MEHNLFNSIFNINFANLQNLALALVLNSLVLLIIVNFIYKRHNTNREFLFTFGIFNIVIFIICFLLSNATLSIGFSFGLFAIFSILRYRTVPMPIKEMTYFFLSISVAIINALSSTVIGAAELLIANSAIIIATLLFERVWRKSEAIKYIKYEKIELIKPENYSALIADLTERTGLEISRVEIGRIDFLRDLADIRVYYTPTVGHYISENISDDEDDD